MERQLLSYENFFWDYLIKVVYYNCGCVTKKDNGIEASPFPR